MNLPLVRPRVVLFGVVALASLLSVASLSIVTPSPASAQIKQTKQRKQTAQTKQRKQTAQTKQSFGQRTPFPEFDATYATFLRSVGRDLDRFWSAEFPRVYGRPYESLAGYFPSDLETTPPNCGGRVRYEDVAGNAFYCSAADYIAFDNAQLFPSLNQRIGKVSLAMVLAHEMGHALQARIGMRLPSVYAELQADCFAGSWLRRYVDGEASSLRPPPDAMEQATVAALSFRDRPGSSADRSGAHGNGFDRVGALQLGFDGGVDRCSTFASDPPIVTAAAFRTAAEAASGGDLDISEAVRLTVASADQHFAELVGSPPTRRASDQELTAAYTGIGDLALATVLLEDWTTTAANALWPSAKLPNRTRELRSVCLTGTWVGAAQRGELGSADSPVSLSPGDLDEALIATIQSKGQTTSFQRVRALRAGFQARGKLSSDLKLICGRF